MSKCKHALSNDVLCDIIATQTEIAEMGVDLAGVMELVADRISTLTNSSGAVVELAEGDDMVYRATSGSANNQLGLRIKRCASLSGLSVNSMRILKCDDSENDERVDRWACRKVGLRSMVVAPLSHLETVVGVLKIISPEPNYFSDQHIAILEIMSQMIGASMYYSAKYEISEMYHKATHDTMTGLANRALFYDRLRQDMARANRSSSIVGLLNIDLDGFKAINDTYGHRAGDAAICEFAKRAMVAVRETDTVARLGGDEFGVVLPGLKKRSDIEVTVNRINDKISDPFKFEDAVLQLKASIGSVLFPDDAQGVEELMDKADKLMYQKKRAKKVDDLNTPAS